MYDSKALLLEFVVVLILLEQCKKGDQFNKVRAANVSRGANA
jgi:hypothetical protein